MIFELEQALFEPDAQPVSLLVSLLSVNLLTESHAARVFPPFERGGDDAIHRWLRRQEAALRDELEGALLLEQSSNFALRDARFIVHGSGDERQTDGRLGKRISLDTALRLTRRPLGLLLENATSDGLFLQAVVPSQHRAQFIRLLEHREIILEQGGGMSPLKTILEGLPSRSFVITICSLCAGMTGLQSTA